MVAVVFTDLEYRDDAGVVEIGGGLGLEAEALDLGVVGELPGEDHLERTVRLRLTCRAWKTMPMPPRAISRMIS